MILLSDFWRGFKIVGSFVSFSILSYFVLESFGASLVYVAYGIMLLMFIWFVGYVFRGFLEIRW